MREVRQLVHRVADAGATVLFSSHVLAEVEQTCSHAVVMDKGHLVAAGSVAELIGSSGVVYLEVDDVAAARRVLSTLPAVQRRGTGAAGPHGEHRRCVTFRAGRRARARRCGRRDGHRAAPPRGRVPRAGGRGRGGTGAMTRSRSSPPSSTSRRAGSARTSRSAIVVLDPGDHHGRDQAEPARDRRATAGFLIFLGSQSGLLIPAVALRFTSEFLLVIIVALFARRGDRRRGDLGQPAVSADAADPAWPAVHVEADRRDGVRRGSRWCSSVARRASSPEGSRSGSTPIGFFSARPSTASTTLGQPRDRDRLRVLDPDERRSASRFLFGVLTDSTFGAIFSGVGLWMTWLILDQIEPLGCIRDVFPTHYSGDWVVDLHARLRQSRPLARLAAHARLRRGLHRHRRYWWFRRKDVLS